MMRSLITMYQVAYDVMKSEGKSENEIYKSDIYRFNPYGMLELPEIEPSLPSPKDFIRQHIAEWTFNIPEHQQGTSPLAFFFSFDLNGGFFNLLIERKLYVLDVNGKMVERKGGNMNDVFVVNDRETAITIAANLNEQVASHCGGYDTGIGMAKFNIKWTRIGKPTHLFTKEEMHKLYKEADDRRGNKLVIDEYGYAKMLPPDTNGTLFPVCHETFCERRNYVGKYSPLTTFEHDYLESLEAWLLHLQRNIYVYCDGSVVPGSDEVNGIINEISKYY